MSFKQLETGRITHTELWFLVAGFLLGSSMLLPPGSPAGRDAWIAVAAGALGGVLVAWVYMRLYQRFPGKTLVEICRIVYGRFFGTILALLFIWYLVNLASLILTNFGDYMSTAIYRLTPEAALNALLVLTTSYALSGGIEVLARCSIPITAFILAVVVFDSFVLLSRMDVHKLLPILETKPSVFVWTALGATAFPFSEAVAFMMVFPAVTAGPRAGQARRTVVAAIVAIGLMFTLVQSRDVSVLGESIVRFPYSIIQVVRLIDVGAVLTRLEMLTSAMLVTSGFLKFSVLMYGSAVGIAQVFGLRSYKPLVYPLGALLLALSLVNFDGVAGNLRFAVVSYPIWGLSFQLVLPLVTLLVAAIRRLPRTGGQAVQRAGR